MMMKAQATVLALCFRVCLYFRRGPEVVVLLLMVTAALVVRHVPDESAMILLLFGLLFWAGALLYRLEKTRSYYTRKLREFQGCLCKPYRKCPDGMSCCCECHWIIDMDG